MEEQEKRADEMEKRASEHEFRTSNLVLRQAILEVNHLLGVKVFGEACKPGYATLGDIEKQIQE